MSEVKNTFDTYFFYFIHHFQCQSNEENAQKKQRKPSSQLSNCLIDNKRKNTIQLSQFLPGILKESLGRRNPNN